MDPDALIEAARPALDGRTRPAFLLVEQRRDRPPAGWRRALISAARARTAARQVVAEDPVRSVVVVGRDERDDGIVVWTLWGPAGADRPLGLEIREVPAALEPDESRVRRRAAR